MATLRELSVQLQYLQERLEESEGEITEEVQKELDDIEANLASKIDGYCSLIVEFVGDAAKLDAEIARLRDRKEAMLRSSENLKKNLVFWLGRAGAKKVSGDLYSVSLCKNSQPTVRCLSIDDVAEKYLKKKVVVTLDRDAVVEDFKAGVLIDPNLDVSVESHVRIR